jgi:predicted DNA-binding WGR domain protein
MSTMDFRNQEPVWVRYAINTAPGHDKYYEVRIDMDDRAVFVLTKRWGARPDAGGGQIKVEEYQTLPGAIGAANRQLDTKIAKGYRRCERPDGASNKVRREYGPDFYDEENEAF